MPTDTVAAALNAELEGILTASRATLEGIVRDALRRGLDPARYRTPDQRVGDATAAYRARQLARAQAILEDLKRQAEGAGRRSIFAAYRATVSAVDATIGPGLSLDGSFGTTHVRAIEAIARNMHGTLSAACDTTGTNLATVFERADALEGALEVGRSPAPVPFIGRRVDDPYRREALATVAEGIANLDTRRQVTNRLIGRLIDSGVTDAVTGFVDRAGNRWSLDAYGAMVARTTTREAMTRATVNRLREGKLDIVTISSHPHKSDECDPYDGQTFATRKGVDARRGLGQGAAASVGEPDPFLGIRAAPSADGLPVLDVYPPFHPNCAHVLTAGAGNLDAYEANLDESLSGLHDELAARQAGHGSLEEQQAYEAWSAKETRKAMRERRGYHAGWRCFNCKRFVSGPTVTCPSCGQLHGGGYHEAYATR